LECNEDLGLGLLLRRELVDGDEAFEVSGVVLEVKAAERLDDLRAGLVQIMKYIIYNL
jgi:hypothetical protein